MSEPFDAPLAALQDQIEAAERETIVLFRSATVAYGGRSTRSSALMDRIIQYFQEHGFRGCGHLSVGPEPVVMNLRELVVMCQDCQYFEVPRIPNRSDLCDLDRKSTRLNSSHLGISYAVFCLKKKKTQ